MCDTKEPAPTCACCSCRAPKPIDVSAKSYKEAWVIGFEEQTIREEKRDVWIFHRYVGGRLVEGYRPATPQEAAVWVSAIIQGLEPPTALRYPDKYVD